MINSLLPIYNILIPYIISTIFIKYLGKEYIFISFQIIVIFYYNYILIFYYSKRIKYIIYQVIYILLIINIICEEKIKKHDYIHAPRETILELNVNRQKNIISNAYDCKIIGYNTILFKNMNRNITCFFKGDFNNSLIGKNIKAMGIIEEKKFKSHNYLILSRAKVLEIREPKGLKYKLSSELRSFIKSNLHQLSDKYDEVYSFLNAIFLGDRSRLTIDQKLIFQYSGTMHLFAVSGLHIGFLYCFIYWSVFTFCKNKKISLGICLGVLLVYLETIGYPASSVRAYIMIFLWQTTKLIFKKSNSESSLAWACLLILVFQPNQLFTIGFQLSFTVVFTLIKVFNQFDISGTKNNLFIKYFLTSILTSYAAFCGSLLLIYDHFNIIVPGSILINLIVVPIAMLIIVLILLGLILSPTNTMLGIEIVIYEIYQFLKAIIIFTTKSDFTFFKFQNIYFVHDLFHLILPFLIYFIFELKYSIYTKLILLGFTPFFLLSMISIIQ